MLKGRLRCGFVCGRFHHNAFFASRALHIADSTNSSLVYPLLEHIFANQVWIHWYGLGRLTHFSLCIFFFGSSSPTLPLLRFLRLFCQTENDARIKSHVCCAIMSLSLRIYVWRLYVRRFTQNGVGTNTSLPFDCVWHFISSMKCWGDCLVLWWGCSNISGPKTDTLAD